MGLDTTHDCWHGPYSAFMQLRAALAEAAGIPLYCMDGYFNCLTFEEELDYDAPCMPLTHKKALNQLPLSWEIFDGDPLVILLNHSDWGGIIRPGEAEALAPRLRELAEEVDSPHKEHAIQFAKGLEDAAEKDEIVEFR